MKILQTILDRDRLYLFTENPKDDIKIIIDKYENATKGSFLFFLCQDPELYHYKFLGKEYECIRLWYDSFNEVVEATVNELEKSIK